ncbi:MAG: sporulation protein Cse60 [Bacilli bacterium]|nr:sporulation protein Cse60 [Bacilli bacterium]
MKLQVRVIDEEHEIDLEDQVNEFLKEIEPHAFIDIKYDVHAFLSSTGEQIYLYSALIIYRDDEENKNDFRKKLFKK